MRLFVLISLLITSVSFAQNIELTTNFGQNHFFDFKKSNHLNHSDYKNGFSSGFKLAVDDVSAGWTNVRFELGLVNYSGEFDFKSNGKTGSDRTIGEVNSTELFFVFYPVSLQFFKNFELDIGVQLSKSIWERFSGSYEGNHLNMDLLQYEYEKMTLKDKYSSILVKGLKIGINTRFAYNISINNKWSIQPQLNYYFGCSDELELTQGGRTKSMRFYGGVGVRRKLSDK